MGSAVQFAIDDAWEMEFNVGLEVSFGNMYDCKGIPEKA
jgi:hypothetical protein